MWIKDTVAAAGLIFFMVASFVLMGSVETAISSLKTVHQGHVSSPAASLTAPDRAIRYASVAVFR